MRTQLSLVDIATSAIRALKEGMEGMYQFKLLEFPEIIREEVFVPRLVGSNTEFIAFIRLNHEASMSTGYVAIHIPKRFAEKLLRSSGLEEVSDKDISDSCGELCNLVTGTFKNELSMFVEGDIQISTPKLFTEGIFEEIEGVNVDEKYILRVQKRGLHVMEMHLAFQSIK